MTMHRAAFGLVLLLAACGRPAPDAAVDEGNPLETAARERGIVRPEAAEPTGVFERRHDLGRDAMCVVPDGDGKWRFALTAAFGAGLSCEARGTIVRDGEGWRLDFAGVEGCGALVREEEDELRLPGSLPSQCDSLCPSRASLSGLRLPRASWSAGDAKRLRMKGDDGNMTMPCGS